MKREEQGVEGKQFTPDCFFFLKKAFKGKVRTWDRKVSPQHSSHRDTEQ